MDSRLDLAGPRRAQPGINFLTLQSLHDVLPGLAADPWQLVSPARAVRPRAPAEEDAAPAAPERQWYLLARTRDRR